MCYDEMTDVLRIHFLDAHNTRRISLALGNLVDYESNTLPTATNMYRLIWNCDLEKESIDFIKTCPSDPTLVYYLDGKNVHTQPANDLTFKKGVKNAIMAWFSPYRSYKGPGLSATFSGHHHREIFTYTQVFS
ncbi:SCP-like protein [Oesophagostomum dentatum]|uniref:SCP-like protein n=1 Tax=Oesophagostomum dentatum TaxID=61180 RepID=A0A0B1SMJ5_OESDE|nr:SCP-like protein [Oesophagostomum dentatum]